MPELPEVETTRRGIAPHATGEVIEAVIIREPRLRWPVAADLPGKLTGQRIHSIGRRAKYLLFETTGGSALVHLGMSGSLRVVDSDTAIKKHDHFDFVLANGKALRFHDPRRFGSLLWADDVARHPLLKELGPEPLDGDFDGEHLYRRSRGRRVAVKAFVMNSQIVVGVGNIYASEALFRAGIHPRRAAGRIAAPRYERLADEIKTVLGDAIRMGGTTLRDFYGSDGSPGYFSQKLNVYDRKSEPCRQCAAPIRRVVIGQRATYYCGVCQR